MKVVVFGEYTMYFIPRLIAFADKLKSDGGELWVLQATKKSLLYDKLPQIDISALNIVYVWDAPAHLNYQEKAYYMLDKLNPDVLMTGFIAFPYGAIGLKWAKSRNKGIVEHDNQRNITFPRGKITNWVKKRILRNVDAFFCPAPAWDETLLEWGFSKSEIFYGVNTSDNNFWGEVVDNVDFQNLPQTYFMTVGRQTNMKNLPYFLSAYKEYLKRGGTIPLVMVGEGSEHEKLVDIANGDNRISFLGFQTSGNIKQLFVRMRALVLPSTKAETWGNVVNECMASGHIVAISKECGSATTLVKDGVNGFHFSPNNAEEMIAALFKIQNFSEEEYDRMSKASLEIISHWGLERFVDGAYGACQYALQNKKKVTSLIDRLFIYLWKGRYNMDEVTK